MPPCPACRAAVLGAFLGDTMALGLHWNYNAADIASLAAPHLVDGRLAGPLPPAPGSYHAGKAAGDGTHYGDQALVLLESLAPSEDAPTGGFMLHRFYHAWLTLFQGGYAGYVDGATRGTLERFAAGATAEDGGSPSTDLAGAARMAPLLAIYGQDLPALLTAARAQTRMTHNHAQVLDAAAFFSRAVAHLLHGAPVVEALLTAAEAGYATSHIQDWVRAGLASKDVETVAAIEEFGQSCAVASAFPAVIHLCASYADDLALGITRNVLAGGDSAARGMAVGMLLGAHGGMDALPGAWLDGLTARPRILALLDACGC
ncbi:MAG: ADP-ribosylglycohydrolase family protein [Desulfovibrio sp.]|nr:ADP-ribosylglycohydrolase family protein [Desulfovibrio sp.]MCA1985307.1 ADP-ribosylglycohydrolase family protein [Desulfovibrio sp.]